QRFGVGSSPIILKMRCKRLTWVWVCVWWSENASFSSVVVAASTIFCKASISFSSAQSKSLRPSTKNSFKGPVLEAFLEEPLFPLLVFLVVSVVLSEFDAEVLVVVAIIVFVLIYVINIVLRYLYNIRACTEYACFRLIFENKMSKSFISV